MSKDYQPAGNIVVNIDDLATTEEIDKKFEKLRQLVRCPTLGGTLTGRTRRESDATFGKHVREGKV